MVEAQGLGGEVPVDGVSHDWHVGGEVQGEYPGPSLRCCLSLRLLSRLISAHNKDGVNLVA